MSERFDQAFFAGNRARLRELFTGTAPIVITANGLLQRSGDTTFPFRQDPSFWYLTGIDEPDVVLVLDKNKEYLILPTRHQARLAFEGGIDLEAMARQSGIATILQEKEGWKQLANRLGKVKHVATIAAPPRFVPEYGMYTNPARASLIRHLKEHNRELDLLDISEHMIRLRLIKQPAEIAAIQQAIDITAAAIKDATRPSRVVKYKTEHEICTELTYGFLKRGATGHAFDPIVATGKNATRLHYIANSATLSADELVVLDVGAAVGQYGADITRTIALAEPTRRQQQVFDAVNDVRQYAHSLLRPGVSLKEYEEQMEQYMGEKLRELMLIKTIDSESVRAYYPHATSHFLGLNIHDVGSREQPLERDMILTVEPGIYIPEEGVGIRIEDDVRVTEGGIEIMSDALPVRLN